MEDLQAMSRESARALGFVSEKLTLDEDIYVVGTNEEVKGTLQSVGVWEELNVIETYDATKIATSS